MEPDVAAVVRSSDERTTSSCVSLLARQVARERIVVVREAPFEHALRRTYEIGAASGAEWTFVVDADILLARGAVEQLLAKATAAPSNVFQLQGRIFCKLYCGERNGGPRLYRSSLLVRALQHVPNAGVESRPEFATVSRMAKEGYPSLDLYRVLGVHDFEQSLRDIYRKAFVHGQKHAGWLPRVAARWRQLAESDVDYKVALVGLWDGLMSSATPLLDINCWADGVPQTLLEQGITEKGPLDLSGISSEMVEAILISASSAGRPTKHAARDRLEPFRTRVRKRLEQFGFVGLLPWCMGSVLERSGAALKRLSANRATQARTH